jgi:hypothetical protein
MKFDVKQRSDEFFELYLAAARTLHAATEALKDLIDNYEDVDVKAGRIKDLEREGDEATHSIIKLVNTMFITPMDREDIYALATSLDDVLDEVEAVADLFVLHAIEAPLPQMKQQVDILLRAVIQTEEAIKALPQMKREVLEPYWIEINRLENEGDEVYRHAIASLFSGDYKAMDVLKWKEIIEDLERATDGLEHVANIIEATVLKHT